MSGQGKYGSALKQLIMPSLKECQQKCEEETGCIGIDYMEAYNPYKCRLYPDNIPRTDPGTGDRTYCKMQGET